MAGLSDNDFSFFEAKSPDTNDTNNGGKRNTKTSLGQSPGVKNSDLLIGLFSAPDTSIPDTSTTNTTNTSLVGMGTGTMATSLKPIVNNSNKFSTAPSGVFSNTKSESATSGVNDDDDFGDFVDSSSSNTEFISVNPTVITDSSSALQHTQNPIFASFPFIASSTPNKDQIIDHNTINVTHNTGFTGVSNNLLSPQTKKPNHLDHVSNISNQPSPLLPEMPHELTSNSVRTTQKDSDTDTTLCTHEQKPQTSNVFESANNENFKDLTSSSISSNSLTTITDVSPTNVSALISENTILETKKSSVEEKELNMFDNVPSSSELIRIFNDKVLHFVDQLFEKLVPLPYALKKRVLANIGTKKFLDGYLATVQVGIMILEGRYRRLHRYLSNKSLQADNHDDPDSDRLAREFVRIWTTEIAPRLRTAGLRPVELSRVPLSVTSTSQMPESSPTCAVCGLARNEQPSVYLLSSGLRWEEKSGTGHLNCLRFWAHRHVYGITI